MITNAKKSTLISVAANAVEVASIGSLALQSNRYDLLYPSATASVELSAGLLLAPSFRTSRFTMSTAQPRQGIPNVSIEGQYWVVGSEIVQFADKQWQRLGQFNSPAASANPVTVNGGTSTSVDNAIIAAGDGGQVVLEGSINLTRVIRTDGLLAKGQSVTIIFDSPTISWNSTPVGAPSPVFTTVSYPADSFDFNPATSVNQTSLRSLLVNASFSR